MIFQLAGGEEKLATADPVTLEVLGRALSQERLENARRINRVRLVGVSVFFCLFLVLAGGLRLKTWQGNLHYFAGYWSLTVGVFLLSRRFESVSRVASLAIPFLDMPMVFLLQYATYPHTANPAATAGYSIGFFVFLVLLAALSLENWKIFVTAMVGAGFEAGLQYLAKVELGAIVATFLLMGTVGLTCAYGSGQLVRLIKTVVVDLVKRQRAEETLRLVEYAATEQLRASAASERRKADALEQAMSQLKDAQDARMKAEKLAVIGQMAAGIAHDLRNPLAAVRNAQLFIRKRLGSTELAKDERAQKMLGIIEKELEACHHIVGELMDFAGERPLELEPWSLHKLVSDAMSVVQALPHVSLRNEVSERMAPVVVDKLQFRKVLVNLLQNAADALPSMKEGWVRVRAQDEGQHVTVEISDNGTGISEDNLRRVFDPLFTTKASGTGLGLGIVSTIVRRHEGTIHVDSHVGEGTTFRLVLPRLVAQEVKRPTA